MDPARLCHATSTGGEDLLHRVSVAIVQVADEHLHLLSPVLLLFI